jgi:hypothetical protein
VAAGAAVKCLRARIRDYLWSIRPVLTTEGKRAEEEFAAERNAFDLGRAYERAAIRRGEVPLEADAPPPRV